MDVVVVVVMAEAITVGHCHWVRCETSRATGRTHVAAFTHKRAAIERLDDALNRHDATSIAVAERSMRESEASFASIRGEMKQVVAAAVPHANTKDADYVFLSFVMRNLPRGIVGLLLAVIFCAAMSAVASELSALASTTVVDFYRRGLCKNASDAHYVRAARWFTAAWGILALPSPPSRRCSTISSRRSTSSAPSSTAPCWVFSPWRSFCAGCREPSCSSPLCFRRRWSSSSS